MRIAPLLALVLFSAAAHGAPDAGVDRVLAARIDGDRSGVCVVAVVVVRQRDGAVRRAAGRSLRDRAVRCRPAPGYRFEIGSISKAFTGVLLSEMVERKELSLDDTVQQHLPAGVTMPRFEGLEVTLRDLVTHTSGLPALPPGMRPASPLNPYADVDEKLIVGGLAQLTLTHPPGEQHAYSNWAFMLLSDILGRRAGQPYDALLTERVLAPLGMKDTVVSDNRRLIPGHTSFGRDTAAWDFPARFGGVGAIRSTPEDMARFARAMLGDVPKDAPDTLKRALVASTQPQRVVNERLTMATAWFVLKRPESADAVGVPQRDDRRLLVLAGDRPASSAVPRSSSPTPSAASTTSRSTCSHPERRCANRRGRSRSTSNARRPPSGATGCARTSRSPCCSTARRCTARPPARAAFR